MKTSMICSVLLLASGSLIGQDSSKEATSRPANSLQSSMPEGIENTLKKYVSAYERRSMPDLLVVWPGLQSDKREFQKVKQHFDDGKISNEHVTLHPLETQTLKDEAVVRCERTEQFIKTDTLESGGDMMMGRYPGQNSGPKQAGKPIKKAGNIWMKLHKEHDDWTIIAVSEKPLSF